ncbi:hypothetical protein TTHERM_00423350 (macronuclear) [Tetrahymena thermophila SB210]|uniref:Zinc carboxypeptidase family protein n=1 Tax=Tetrahymena thermophila (strain SB210) TaxID=312017 RepID=Q23AM6_TETTS|nr:hypothetical protein TTHERM_00423350 [Tetrahymena thermophila SB210]EAR93466.1 hypothetical protein TTHERM_00423350 [Tetrahymena thermophila SB210]|eukprot:XP_001013711.1 hypothetical protein TTHERM_00423350 [Tetrahymena thermophila SB210]
MEILKIKSKCVEHGLSNKHLFIQEINIHTKICINSAQKLLKESNKIGKIIEYKEFLSADENHIFENFPPLEYDKIYDHIKNQKLKKDLPIKEIFKKKINDYFINLRNQIKQKIDQLQIDVEQKLIEMYINKNQGNTFLDIYNELSSKFDIQQQLKDQQQDSEQRIKEIIQQKYQNIKENTDKLQKSITEYQKIISKVDLTIPNLIQQKILNLIDKIDFFNIISNIEFEKSKSYGSSQNLQIQRLQNRQIQITQSISDAHGVSYANFILDPNQKYIFRVKLQTNSQNDSFLVIGIIKEQDKDNQKLYNTICYNETGVNNTITKIVKGKDVFEGKKTNIDKEIEVRIHLAQKMFKVANYPNYENVAELKNNQDILDNTQYRFAVELHYQVHKIIITHIQVVDEFNQNM